ncbi:MAG TPA: ribosome maturation factor RimP [Clostridia bacterium]
MGSRTSIAQAAQAIVADTLTAMGLDLVDVEYVREGKTWYLRFFIDKRGGVTLDDCANASRTIDPLLDTGLEIMDSYCLEVSSPGLERPLRKPSDFERYMGEPVEVTLYRARNGTKRFEGSLTGFNDEGTVTLLLVSGEQSAFLKEEIARVRRAVRF